MVETGSSVTYSPPQWLDKKFLDEHLQKYHQNMEIQVINFDVKPAVGKGENYFSCIHRVNVTFISSGNNATKKGDTTNISLIVKEESTDEWLVQTSAQFHIFDKETEFYREISSKINKILNELGEEKLFAELIGVCKLKKIMILEDLSADGYRILPVKDGFNFEETKALLKRIATFHATCAVLQEEKSDIFVTFKYGHISRGADAFKDYYPLTLDAVIEIISEWPDFAVYVEKLRRLRNRIYELGCQAYDLNLNHFNTLNHDDLWGPNFMIKTRDGSPEKPFENVKLIDFQFAYWSSPTTDLFYFLNSSVNEALRPERFDELVQFYHEQLVDFLKRLNYKKRIPTWPEFQEQYYERRILGFISSCLIQPFMLNNTEEATFDIILQDNDIGLKARRGFYKGDKFQENLRKLIPFYDQLGTFD
ncbi:uncharacterized protein LOC129568209 [Sitodiplosis mosellana]|uniref:uncharacterized protein LOC129568209 n=1 Tax=Sitodiplosis mosellana TaxID=263140 RepID=UPI0024441954|nr:uncharacterized protein LOC129568209 [Sitodiplosis mosellana]